MDKSLLSGESSHSHSHSRGSGNLSPQRNRKRAFAQRSDAIAYGSPYQKAAALVDLAEDGTGLPEEILDNSSSFESAAKFYFMFFRFDYLWSLNYFALIILNFLEEPLWCAKASDYSCKNREYYFLGELPYLTGAESLIYEGITLIILAVATFSPISYEGLRLYYKNHINKLKVISLIVLVADMVVFSFFLSPVASFSLPFRIAPYIRIVLFILNIRDLRDSILILAGMLGTYLNILALGLLFLLFSSWMAYVMFEDTAQQTVFTSFGKTMLQMFVLFTTSNNPDVWIPAYKVSRWYCLFFILYVLLAVYFVTNLILAVVYDSFKGQLAKQVLDKDRVRIRILRKAFNLIDDNNLGFLNKDQCIRLFEELNTYRTLPKISGEDFELIFDELDDSNDFKINLDEFDDLCNVIALRFQKEDSPPIFEYFPAFYRSSSSEKLKSFVKSPKFGYIVASTLILNLVAVIIETTLDINESSGQKYWQSVEFVFGWLYVVEMAFKIYAYGFVNYWRDGQNQFDFIITWVIVIGETTTFVSPSNLTFLSNGEWIRYLLIARMLRLIRLLMHVKRYRAFIATFLTLIPSLLPYLGTIFCVLCIYCSLGVQIFGGIVNAGNLDIYKTDMADSDYLLFNFNDYSSGMVTLFNVVVMGNWQVWMESYKDLTGTAWTYAYFLSFYVITILLLLNLIVAFVLEAFFAEMEMEISDNCEEPGKETGGTDRRRVGSKTRSQRVEALLHHMLSAEMDQCSSS